MRVIEITEKKRHKMADYAEKMLRYGGKLMQCLDELDEESDMGERDDWDDDDDDDMGERRRRNSRGRFTRR